MIHIASRMCEVRRRKAENHRNSPYLMYSNCVRYLSIWRPKAGEEDRNSASIWLHCIVTKRVKWGLNLNSKIKFKLWTPVPFYYSLVLPYFSFYVSLLRIYSPHWPIVTYSLSPPLSLFCPALLSIITSHLELKCPLERWQIVYTHTEHPHAFAKTLAGGGKA